jgi:hypothetical protein
MRRSQQVLGYAAGQPRPATQRRIHALIVLISAAVAIGMNFVIAVVVGASVASEIIIIGSVMILVASLVGLLLGLFIPTTGKCGKCGLASLCLAPAILIAYVNIRERWEDHNTLPIARFRDHLADPVPSSVLNLRFVPLKDKRDDTSLMLRFDIAPHDMDSIIAKKVFLRTPPTGLYNRADAFRDAQYLRLGDQDELYQAKGKLDGLCTLRINQQHTSAIFRYETPVQVSWQNGPTTQTMNERQQ